MQRGEVWWARLPPPTGRRPVLLLLSRNVAYRVRASITVAAITRSVRGIPTEVPLDEADGMPARCVANLDDILTIPNTLLEQPVTSLSSEKMAQVWRAITFALDLEGKV